MFSFQPPEQYAFALANLPHTLICHESGMIALVKKAHFELIYEYIDNVEIIITKDSVKFISDNVAECEEIEYYVLTSWKDKPLLVQWLQSFQLQLPQFN